MSDARLYLAAAPTVPASIPAIFRSEEPRRILESPPITRQNGFNLATYERATIDRGERLPISAGTRKRLDLYKDGTFIAYAAFPDFLGWPRDANQFAQNPKVNSLALIEFVYDFATAYEQVLDHIQPFPPSVQFSVGVRDAHLGNGRRLYLAPYGLGSIGFEYPRGAEEAPDNEVERSLVVEVAETKPHYSPGAVAYQLAELLYNWFGLSSEQIPYLNEERTEVSPEAIQQS